MMKTTKLWNLALLLSLAVATAACSGGGGDDDDDDDDDAPISETEAQLAGSDLGDSVIESLAAFEPQNFASAQMFAGQLPACAVLTGDSTDPDLDYWQTDATYTYTDCTYGKPGFEQSSYNGTRHIQDTAPAAAAYAWLYETDMTADVTLTSGQTMAFAWDGTWTASSNTTGGFALDYVWNSNSIYNTDTLNYTGDYSYDWSLAYDPDTTWTPGTVLVAGNYTMSGTWTAVITSGGTPSTFNATTNTPTPLHINPACIQYIDSGLMTQSYSSALNNYTLSVLWTGCSAPTVTFTGTPIQQGQQ